MSFLTADVLTAPWPAADVVFANLTGAMLIRVAAHLASLTAPGGRLITSGFIDDEAAAVEAAFDGFAVETRDREDEWCACVLRRAAD